MKTKLLERPIGLHEVCNKVENNCNLYTNGYLLKPKPLLINLDSGQGRTTLLEYIVGMYKVNNVIKFQSGLIDYLEFSFDGANTTEQMKYVFNDYYNSWVYENYFTDVVVFDITEMLSHTSDIYYMKTFMSELDKVSKHCHLILFVKNKLNGKELDIMCKIEKQIRGEFVKVSSYTVPEMIQIIDKVLLSKRYNFLNSFDLHESIFEILDTDKVDLEQPIENIVEQVMNMMILERVPKLKGVQHVR